MNKISLEIDFDAKSCILNGEQIPFRWHEFQQEGEFVDYWTEDMLKDFISHDFTMIYETRHDVDYSLLTSLNRFIDSLVLRDPCAEHMEDIDFETMAQAKSLIAEILSDKAETGNKEQEQWQELWGIVAQHGDRWWI